ncbi:MAG: FAD-dependent oxidoreductase [Desulfobacteraceae bacterium]|nr:MAG: FAD-dependent oxidoreductase [Desulfobacteraceae bacterium]
MSDTNTARFEADVLVIGGGLAGTFAALKAKEYGAENVVIVDKSYVGKSGCSAFAAGVFTAFMPEKDDFEVWMKEIVTNGESLNNQEWLELHLSEIYKRVLEMDSWGVLFRKDNKGNFLRTPGRGGSRNFKFLGPQLMEAMRKKCEKEGIRLLDWTMTTSLITADDRVLGAIGFHCRTGEFKVFKAKSVVVATGGCRFKTILAGHRMTTGDGHAMLLRSGCEMTNLEFNQSNIAAANIEMSGPGMNMYQGLGAKFINKKGEAFMVHYDPNLKDRAPLRMLAGAMAVEASLGNNPFYIDMTHFSPEQVRLLKEVLPLPTMALERAGYIVDNRFTDKIEWIPMGPNWASYGGGARINLRCETNIQGLFAAGDATAKMAAGTNEMGAGAMPNAAVTGALAGRYAAEYSLRRPESMLDSEGVEELRRYTMGPCTEKEGYDPEHLILTIQETITPYKVGMIKREDRLKTALGKIREIKSTIGPYLYARDPHYLRLAHEARNMTLCAEHFLHAALLRKESRGTGFREDFPFRDNVNWLKWVVVRRCGEEIEHRMEEIPLDKYKVKPERTIEEHPLVKVGKNRGLKWE